MVNTKLARRQQVSRQSPEILSSWPPVKSSKPRNRRSKFSRYRDSSSGWKYPMPRRNGCAERKAARRRVSGYVWRTCSRFRRGSTVAQRQPERSWAKNRRVSGMRRPSGLACRSKAQNRYGLPLSLGNEAIYVGDTITAEPVLAGFSCAVSKFF